MLAHATDWLVVAIALGALAGLRMGEVRALEVQDVDFVDGCIHVRRALSEREVTTPKSGADRNVPMHPASRPSSGKPCAASCHGPGW
jgi:integrase